MRKTALRRIRLLFVILFLPAALLLIFSGCQSTDRTHSYLDKSGLSYASFEYDSANNRTEVIFRSTLTNETIYDFNGFTIEVSLYSGSTSLGTKTYDYDVGVKHGKSYSGLFSFYAAGSVTSVTLHSWTPHYISFWKTYRGWLISDIVLVAAASVVFILFIIFGKMDLSDIGSIFKYIFERWSILLTIGLFIIACLISAWITESWIPLLLYIGGIFAFAVIHLLAHLVKFIVMKIIGEVPRRRKETDYTDDVEEELRPAVEDVWRYIDDVATLLRFPLETLQEFCRQNGIEGYASLTQPEVVRLIRESVAMQKGSAKGPPQ